MMALSSGSRSEMVPDVNSIVPMSMLVVEDEKSTLDLLIAVLSKKYPDAELHSAVDGQTGLEIFQAHRPYIVITDINMPDMSGVEMAHKIRAIKPDSKIIVLTGDTGKLALEASIGGGFKIDHYIVKPVR